MYYTLYKTTNILNNKFYIGVHATTEPHDEYIGSGTLLLRAVKKYGKDNFKKEILAYVNNSEELYELEELVVYEIRDHDLCYNLAEGGYGYTTESAKAAWTEERREEHRIRARLLMEELNKEKWSDPEYVKYQSQIQSKISSDRWKDREYRNKWMNTRNTPEFKAAIGKQTRDRNLGRKWLTDGNNDVFVHKDKFDKYFAQGYRLGRSKNKKRLSSHVLRKP